MSANQAKRGRPTVSIAELRRSYREEDMTTDVLDAWFDLEHELRSARKRSR